jgi:hypothetical protein
MKDVEQQLLEEAYEQIAKGFTGQILNFKQAKPEILKLIQKLLDGKATISDRKHNPFYGIIVGKGKIGDAERMGFSQTFKELWKKTLQTETKNEIWRLSTDGVWSQVNINNEFQRKIGSRHTLNFYITVVKTKNNIINFFNNLYKVKDFLIPVSEKFQTPISYKTHCLLDSFIGHNDSFKVYFYDSNPEIKKEITLAIKKWLNENNIETCNRTHDYGIDLKGEEGSSFGISLSLHMFDSLAKVIKDYSTKFTPEQYYQWLVKHAPTMLKSAKLPTTL